MDPRQERGLAIAATTKIKRRGAAWIVPARSQPGSYTVYPKTKQCSCPDYELRKLECKHFYAVQFVMQRETRTTAKGDTVVTETRAVRLTYAQDWASYNAAATGEKDTFCTLLRDLCNTVPEPEQGRGRPRLPLGDMIFAAAFKVYSTVSGRRFMGDLRAACERGLIAKTPHYNSIFNVIESESLTPILHDLITASALPLREVERDFAVDSTGFGTSQYFRYYSIRYGREEAQHDWVKTHAMVGTKTNVVAAVRITERHANDCPELPALVTEVAQNFTVREVSADKAYSARVNLNLIDDLGADPFIAFKKNARACRYSPAWTRMYHYFALHRDEFLARYHKRSNVETTFSMIKRVFGDSVRSKSRVAQENEVLLKIVCHNIRCLIHEMHELGITPEFGTGLTPAAQQS